MATSSAAIQSPLLTINEAAKYLRIDRSTFVMSVRHSIPAVRPTPGRVLYRREDLDAYIAAQRREPPL
jgi:excisionase family DNA binding protein